MISEELKNDLKIKWDRMRDGMAKNGYGCLFAYRRCKSLLYDRTNL